MKNRGNKWVGFKMYEVLCVGVLQTFDLKEKFVVYECLIELEIEKLVVLWMVKAWSREMSSLWMIKTWSWEMSSLWMVKAWSREMSSFMDG